MAFEYQQKVLFKHCDPAGIVFYPRYFEMMNDCVEAFFESVLKLPFHGMHETGGVPTAEIKTRFLAPSRHGDMLRLVLRILRVGRSSTTYDLTAFAQDDRRFETTATLVFVDQAGRPQPWTDAVRARLNEQKES